MTLKTKARAVLNAARDGVRALAEFANANLPLGVQLVGVGLAYHGAETLFGAGWAQLGVGVYAAALSLWFDARAVD